MTSDNYRRRIGGDPGSQTQAAAKLESALRELESAARSLDMAATHIRGVVSAMRAARVRPPAGNDNPENDT